MFDLCSSLLLNFTMWNNS